MSKPIAAPAALSDEWKAVFGKLKPETQFFVSKTIKTQSFKEAVESIEATHNMYGAIASGMILYGEPGVGKSAILETYVSSYLASCENLETDELTRVPIIKINIPSRPTINSLIVELLEEAGHTELSGTQSKLNIRLREFIKSQGVELLIFDEFQHLLREQAQISTRNVLNYIKTLMDETKVAVIMAGIPEGRKAIKDYGELFQRMTFEQAEIKPYNLKLKDACSEFVDLMQTIELILADAGIKIISLTNKTILQRVFLATGGRIRLIERLIAKVLETSDLTKTVNISDFERVYERNKMNPELNDKFNPFSVSDKAILQEKAGWYK